MLGIPLSFVVLGMVLLVFAVGYTAMSQHVQNAGAFYAYVARGLGKPTGIGAAWVALVSYNAMQIGIYGMFGFALADFLTTTFGLSTPWWVCALIGWAVVAILGVNKVDLSAKVLGIVVACEFLVVIVYDVLALKVAPEGISTESLQPAQPLHRRCRVPPWPSASPRSWALNPAPSTARRSRTPRPPRAGPR